MPQRATLTTTGVGPATLLRNYWAEKLLDILTNELLASDLMETQAIPSNSGNVIEFHRIGAFSKQMAGVSEFLGYMSVGDLKGQSFTVDTVVYGLELLTNDLRMTEKSIMTMEPNPIPTLTERFLYNSKDTIDQRSINIMVSNTGSTQTSTVPSVTFFGTSRSVSQVWGDGSATLTEATLDADNPSHRVAAESFNTCYTTLKGQSAKPRKRGSPFDCLVAPQVSGDLRTDATFQDIALKGTQRGEDKFEQASIGTVFGVRVMEDENVNVGQAATIDATNDVIIRCPVVGEGYAARISYAKGIGVPAVNFIPPGKADKADPYGLVGIMTWKTYAATGGVLNPLAGVILKVATTRPRNTFQTDDGAWDV